MDYAARDLRAARSLLGGAWSFHIAVYLAQQAAEKAVKAALVAGGQTPPKVHDIGLLVARLGGRVAGLPSAVDVDRLTGYAVSSRYPDDLPDVNEAEAEEAVETAEAVLAAVRAHLGA